MGLEANIRHVTPYVPGEQPRQKVIKLNTNENPYPPAPGAMEMLHQMDPEKLRMYPDPEIKMLTECLASRYQVRPEQVFVGVGSDDVLAMSFLTFFNSGKPVLFPDITYSFYKVWAELYRVPYTCPSLDGTMHIRAEDYCGENGGIILANPNAPTGLYESLDVIEKILKENPGVVVIVDEAYIDFAGKPSAVSLVDRYENLLVTQTFSKSRSMAGVRIGFAIGNERLIRWLLDVKYSFNSYTLSALAILCGTKAVEDETYFQKTTSQIIATREGWLPLVLNFRIPAQTSFSHGIRSTMGKCCFKRCDRDRSMSDIGISQRSGSIFGSLSGPKRRWRRSMRLLRRF